MIVVLDTNIWVSAIIWGGIPDQIVSLKQLGQIEIAKADVIVTGDLDLLVLAEYANIQIMNAKIFWQRYFANYLE